MFRIKTWIPVETDPEEDMQYNTREDAEKEKAQLEEMQPENKYEVIESDEEAAFVHADQWRELTANDIISSIGIGLWVLREKENFSKEYHRQLLVLIEEIAKMMLRDIGCD